MSAPAYITEKTFMASMDVLAKLMGDAHRADRERIARLEELVAELRRQMEADG